jgi:hypothetical protein
VTWLGDRFRGAIESGIEGLIWKALLFGAVTLGGLALTVGLLIARSGAHVPAWWLGIVFGISVGLAIAYGWRARRWLQAIDDLEWQLALSGYASELLHGVLETLQKVLHGAVRDVTLDTLVERGVLETAREFIERGSDEEVRLSVLVPDGDDFVMRWAAGHRLESQRKFRQPLDEMFARFSYRSGEVEVSDDVTTDERWKPLAKATRPYSSLVTVPICRGDQVAGVLNAISTYPAAFAEGDIIFLQLLATIIEVAWAPGVFDDDARR